MTDSTPNYAELVRFLMQPFLDSPDALKVDCEFARSRVWVRVALEGADKGRVFGRGGRNVQALRNALNGVAKTAGQTVNLDIFGGNPVEDSDRPPRSMPKPKPH
jgi:predicted RNA-binding protein YlqC (UPF0109 family)